MREPVFNETMQLGIVVRDLEATVRRYEDDYGIGPWRFDRIDLGAANDYREYGEPVERSNRIAIAMVGRVMWELIEPLDEDGIYARFLAEKGEGVHHVAVATPDFDETVARAERKDGVMLSCKHSGIDIAYLDTLRDLGVTIEIFSGMPPAPYESRTRRSRDPRSAQRDEAGTPVRSSASTSPLFTLLPRIGNRGSSQNTPSRQRGE
jgi:methylmalonyl-CoA/ethylmalonyl-CoA epimerase